MLCSDIINVAISLMSHTAFCTSNFKIFKDCNKNGKHHLLQNEI